jgi:hypothetical protein
MMCLVIVKTIRQAVAFNIIQMEKPFKVHDLSTNAALSICYQLWPSNFGDSSSSNLEEKKETRKPMAIHRQG